MSSVFSYALSVFCLCSLELSPCCSESQRRIIPLEAGFSSAHVPWPTLGVTPLCGPGAQPHGDKWPESCGFVILPSSQIDWLIMKHGTTNNGYTLSTLDGTRLRQTQTPDVADNSYVCSLPLVAPGAALVWRFCLCLEILPDSLFFVTMRDPSICPGFPSCCFLSVRAAPGVRHSSCVPAASAADQVSILMPLLRIFAAPRQSLIHS